MTYVFYVHENLTSKSSCTKKYVPFNKPMVQWKNFKIHITRSCFTKFDNVHKCFQIHMRTHTGIRPYQCKLCNKDFTNSTAVSTHMLTHSGNKYVVNLPYK